eukprot:gnl/TRDRNA2_/TRDRNA2_194765_c0_seq1.p2 gnl/TRDRNA2_/TRDRNA2_194765_c0~~gnl/TRDRNA2_/TRDRNA2_194765_c0_seq1.p2  ORF type:complete len:102 (+),score=28.19 gnl/TRDRNA2_/TRDRNA2_194765_c0_seq1:61-366(+)
MATQGGGALLQGEYDEAAAHASFQEAVRQWREGRVAPDAGAGSEADKVVIEPGAPYQLGEHVYVRDYEEQSWSIGVITSIEPVMVQPKGKSKSFTFACMKR